MSHLTTNNDELQKRVRRIAGQVSAIERSLIEEKDCASVLHLVAAVRGAMNGLMDEIIAAHIKEHVAGDRLTAQERAEGAEQVIKAIQRYAK